MKIGVCGGIDRIKATADAGFDYIEGNFSNIALWDDDKYNAFKDELIKYNLPCEAANCFLPGDMKITGESVDYKALENYLLKGFRRAAELGIKVVVMGSGGARSVPAGFSFSKAVNQIVFFVSQYAAPIAAEYGIDFVYRDFRVGFREGQAKARELGLYMQKYCGCVFSEEERYIKQIEKDKNNSKNE